MYEQILNDYWLMMQCVIVTSCQVLNASPDATWLSLSLVANLTCKTAGIW